MTKITGRYTKELARYAADLKYDDIPAEIVEHVKRITLNQVGAALSGWTVGPGSEVFQVLAELGGAEEAAVIGRRLRLPAPTAAAINATLAWVPMNCDTHVDSLFHSGHHSVQPALAEAEVRGAGGRDYITAVVASSEVGIRIARAVSPAHDDDYNSSQLGFWSELRGPFGASVATGKVLGLDAEQFGHALGIAATSTSGLQALGESSPHSGTVYAWEAGKAVLNGMLAARLAATGMTDGPEPLEGPLGWVHAYTWGHGRLEWLTEGLGTVYETGRIQLKTRCNSSMVHSLIDAAYELVHEHGIAPEAVRKVTVRGQQWLRDYLWRRDARTYQDAIFSLPFSIALVIVEPGEMTYPDQVVGRLDDPAVASLMKKIELDVDPSIKFSAEMPGTVTIHTMDGRVHEKESPTRVRGTYPDRPLEPGELEDKVRRLGRQVLAADRLDHAIERIAKLETLDTMKDLTRLLQPQA
jgi:2-methylcitrate dehydratase PrpD